jgi:predicted pyridoxine 5'-phosphate oxidase superfamily flavin-nucleotide-binding protein
MADSPFHADELAAQERAGVSASGSGIRDYMPGQHRAFFTALPYIFVSTVDVGGWPVATLLDGPPGFVGSPDPTRLRVQALPRSEDPAAGGIQVGCQIGILGIDFATRRRNRANGIVAQVDGAAFTVDVKQSLGNCPQYIQRRAIARTTSGPCRGRQLDSLDDDTRALIERADTFFVASRSRGGIGHGGGSDISHRGGRPGFARVNGNTLTSPDFRGNRYLNTLGNLLGEPRCSLLFVDFETGDLLQLQGRVRIEWSPSSRDRFEGAERIWEFQLTRGWYRPQASELRGEFIDYSPVTLRTGAWQ